MSAHPFSADVVVQKLRDVRIRLLRLHKALLDAEKVTYERQYGGIRSNTEFFGLVLEHEWFRWLRPMSRLIADIDEAFASKEAMTAEVARTFLAQAGQLLQPNPVGKTSERKYYETIERDAIVAKLHVEIMQLLQA